MLHTITIAVTVNSYAPVQVEAPSELEAARIVQESIDKEGFDSPYWDQAQDWDTDWQQAENLRVL
jgi:hypothetical protein